MIETVYNMLFDYGMVVDCPTLNEVKEWIYRQTTRGNMLRATFELLMDDPDNEEAKRNAYGIIDGFIKDRDRVQKLAYYPLTSLSDIDFKIKELGKVWHRINNIEISYHGGAYRVDMMAHDYRGVAK